MSKLLIPFIENDLFIGRDTIYENIREGNANTVYKFEPSQRCAQVANVFNILREIPQITTTSLISGHVLISLTDSRNLFYCFLDKNACEEYQNTIGCPIDSSLISDIIQIRITSLFFVESSKLESIKRAQKPIHTLVPYVVKDIKLENDNLLTPVFLADSCVYLMPGGSCTPGTPLKARINSGNDISAQARKVIGAYLTPDVDVYPEQSSLKQIPLTSLIPPKPIKLPVYSFSEEEDEDQEEQEEEDDHEDEEGEVLEGKNETNKNEDSSNGQLESITNDIIETRNHANSEISNSHTQNYLRETAIEIETDDDINSPENCNRNSDIEILVSSNEPLPGINIASSTNNYQESPANSKPSPERKQTTLSNENSICIEDSNLTSHILQRRSHNVASEVLLSTANQQEEHEDYEYNDIPSPFESTAFNEDLTIVYDSNLDMTRPFPFPSEAHISESDSDVEVTAVVTVHGKLSAELANADDRGFKCAMSDVNSMAGDGSNEPERWIDEINKNLH